MLRRLRRSIKLIIICFVFLFVIIICHLLFYSDLESFSTIFKMNTKYMDKINDEDLLLFPSIEKFQYFGHFDVSGKYKIYPYVETAEQWQNLSKRPLCVAAQTSLDRMYRIVELVENWPGAVSLAILAPGPDFILTLHYLQYLRTCYPAVKNQVSIHVVYPINMPPLNDSTMDIQSRIPHWDCIEEPSIVLSNLLQLLSNASVQQREQLLYPQNLLRNIAREHCQSDWITCPDIDMVFPLPYKRKQSLVESLEIFLTSDEAKQCDKCAYVFPVYEISNRNDHIPCTKSQLLTYISNNSARQYHVAIFKMNQGLSRLNEWEKIKPDEFVKIAYSIEKFLFWYEPVYIARRGTPKFDERYVGFGMVRNTQAYEMSLAGYKFYLLDNIFLSHWNYQERSRYTVARTKQNNINFKIFFTNHLRELAARYDSDPENLLAKNEKRKKYNIKIVLANSTTTTTA